MLLRMGERAARNGWAYIPAPAPGRGQVYASLAEDSGWKSISLRSRIALLQSYGKVLSVIVFQFPFIICHLSLIA
jgi:hypothetical protein